MQKTKPKKFIYRAPRNCQFCKEDKNPDYRDVATMTKYMSERGRILGHERTGICSKHQRKLAVAIKRARHMALLPFVSGL